MRLEHATLGAGCFWCVEAVFQALRGVEQVESGYSGGHLDNPSYEAVCSKTSGHVEVVRLGFDPDALDFAQVLTVFWHTHDPTTRDRQGNDHGPQYRSVVFHHDEAQRETAERVLREIDASDLWSDPVVTAIEPLRNYYPAEAYHQDFFNRNPGQPYCRISIPPKLQKLRQRFPELLA